MMEFWACRALNAGWYLNPDLYEAIHMPTALAAVSKEAGMGEMNDFDVEEVLRAAVADEGGDDDCFADAAAEEERAARKAGDWAALYSGSLESLILPELLIIARDMPAAWEAMKASHTIMLTFAADNTSAGQFDGCVLKIEQVVIKILLPGVDSAQQSPFLSIPLAVMDGALRCLALQCQILHFLGSLHCTSCVL